MYAVICDINRDLYCSDGEANNQHASDALHAHDTSQRTQSIVTILMGIWHRTDKSQSSEIPDLSSAVLWHACCMLLCVKMNTLEEACGRNGLTIAARGVEELRAWARTAMARRACLHAWSIYGLLYNRRASEVIGMSLTDALFRSALVLGFYVLVAEETSDSDSKISWDLFDTVDWDLVDSKGLVGNDRFDRDFLSNPEESAELAFIRRGSRLETGGAVLTPGYTSARKTFLHFANLLETVSRQTCKRFLLVLQTISDNLLKLGIEQDSE